MGRHSPRPNKSLTLEMSANHNTAGKFPASTPLLRMHAILFKTPVNSAQNMCWAHICEETRSPQNESTWWQRRQARRQRRAETDVNVHHPTLLPSVRQRAGTSSPPNSPPHNRPKLYVAHVGPVHSRREAREIQWCRRQRAFSRRLGWKQLHLQRLITFHPQENKDIKRRIKLAKMRWKCE
jgi:hypothetical protein